jgi:hypothetical protein
MDTENIEVQTPLGPVWVTFPSGERCHLTACKTHADNFMMFRVEYSSAYAWLALKDGTWQNESYHYPSLGRHWDGHKWPDTSHAALKHFAAKVYPAVIQWIEEHPEVLAAASRKSLTLQIAALQSQIEGKKKEILDLCTQVCALQAKLDN